MVFILCLMLHKITANMLYEARTDRSEKNLISHSFLPADVVLPLALVAFVNS